RSRDVGNVQRDVPADARPSQRPVRPAPRGRSLNVASSRMKRGLVTTTSVAAALTLTACLQNPDAGSGSGGFNADADPEAGDGVVTVLGAFGGPEEEAFRASLEAFTEETGIQVEYVPDQDFTTTILLRVGSGDAPDVGLFPQPGGVLQMAASGDIVPIDMFLD